MEEIDLETKSLKESNENQNESKRAPLWAFAMHWPIISGREATWGVLGAVGLPLQISLQIDDSIASMTTALSASLGHFQNNFEVKHGLFKYFLYTLGYLKLGLDLLPKNWEFRVFAKQAMSKKLGLLRFCQTCLVQKIGTYTLYGPYLLHFGNIQERHFWKKIQNLHFDLWWRHKWLIIYDVMLFLVQLYIKWHKSRDVSSVRNNVILAISPKNPGSELGSFLTKNPGQFFGHYSCWIVFQEWRLLSSRKIIFLKFMTTFSGKKSFFFSRKDAYSFPMREHSSFKFKFLLVLFEFLFLIK